MEELKDQEKDELKTIDATKKPKIREIEIEGEKINLKKDLFGWRIVKPLKNPDGTKNWPNILFGGYRNLVILILLLLLIGGFVFIYHNDVNSIISYYNQTCGLGKAVINISQLNLTLK